MSRENADLLADIANTKLQIDEDTYNTVDSGFLSGSNLMVSSEIIADNDTIAIATTTKEEEIKGPNKDNYMRLDSGVDIIEDFSSLSLKTNPNLNDLTCSKKHIYIQPVESKPEDLLWKVYFEQDEDGDTPLHMSIIQGYEDLALALIRVAPHPLLLDTPNDEAQTPIHLAVSTGQWRIVRWLIVAGVKSSPRNINGDSPLHIAARNGDIQCCKAITDPVDDQEIKTLGLNYVQHSRSQLNLDQWNYEGKTCIHVAAISGNVDVLRHLVNYGADINAREGRAGYTALHYSIERGDEHLTQFLLNECNKLDTNILTYGGNNALQLGCKVPLKIAEILKSRGVVSSTLFTNCDDDDDEDEDENDNSSEELDSENESEHEMAFDNPKLFVANLINASA